MRGWLPILALGACLAAAMPAMAGDTRPGPWVEVYHPELNGSVWRLRGETDEEQDVPRDGSSVPHPTGPTAEATEAGVTVVRGGYSNAPTVEDAADGVTVIRGPGLHH
jgi:hypothetical protein